MKLVQARIPEIEFRILKRKAKQAGKTLQDVIREALRAYVVEDVVDAGDPIFSAFPLVTAEGEGRWRVAERHDEILYGEAE